MEKKEDFLIPDEIAEWIGLKKSEYLSKLIEKQIAGDIGFEQFHLFDSFISSTIEFPDKAYESEEDNQIIRTYIRSYNDRGHFHQVVVGVVIDDKKNNADVFVPILCFASRKDELVREFCVGEVITRPTLN